MATRRIGAACALAVIAAGWHVAPAFSDTQPDLVSHKATYKLTLTRSTGDKAPAAATGMISYEFSGSACEGYATTFRQLTELQPADGESRVSDMRSATFEDGAAKQFNFNTRTTYSSASQDDLDGKAAKQSDGTVSVALEKPETTTSVLKTALFPTEHLRKVIAAAEAGQRVLSEPVFDGSDTGRIIFDTLAVIGAPILNAADEEPAHADAVKNVRRWPVSISYFDQAKSDPQPNYVLSFELYENGVSRALKLDYGTFTMAGELASLTVLPTPTCQH